MFEIILKNEDALNVKLKSPAGGSKSLNKWVVATEQNHLNQWFSKCGTRTTSGTWASSSGTQRNLRIKYKSSRVSTKAIFFQLF